MAKYTAHPGNLNTRVELYKWTTVKEATGEGKKTLTTLGKRWVERRDVSGSEDEEGKMVALSVTRYIMRYESDLLNNGHEYVIKDQDGDFEINSVTLVGVQRNKFIELKCSKRSE